MDHVMDKDDQRINDEDYNQVDNDICMSFYCIYTTNDYSQKDYTTLMDMRTSDNYNGR